jgi:S1-C subfamily serine protease
VIVTNAHVVGDAAKVEISRDREEGRPATVLGVSQCDDLAVVRADEAVEVPALPLGTQPAVDEELWIVGFPGTSVDQEAPLQVHRGPVASMGATYTDRERDLVATYRNLVQVDGTINSGNSGGPLVEQKRGRVVGVAAFGAIAQEENYGISVDRLRELLPYLRDGSSVPGMALGFDEEGDPEPSILDVTSDTLERQGVQGNSGQRLVAVDGKRFDEGEFPNGLASLCDELPTLGDGRETAVRYTVRKPDGRLLPPVAIGY